jgi:hypothetical protein
MREVIAVVAFMHQHPKAPLRAELCGAIIALSAERAVSLAADNSGVAKGIKRASHALARGRSFPYYKRPNADLWKAIWSLLQWHGGAAVRARWTKAHATQQHVQQGTTIEWDAQQNAKADAAADEGRQAH